MRDGYLSRSSASWSQLRVLHTDVNVAEIGIVQSACHCKCTGMAIRKGLARQNVLAIVHLPLRSQIWCAGSLFRVGNANASATDLEVVGLRFRFVVPTKIDNFGNPRIHPFGVAEIIGCCNYGNLRFPRCTSFHSVSMTSSSRSEFFEFLCRLVTPTSCPCVYPQSEPFGFLPLPQPCGKQLCRAIRGYTCIRGFRLPFLFKYHLKVVFLECYRNGSILNGSFLGKLCKTSGDPRVQVYPHTHSNDSQKSARAYARFQTENDPK